MKDNKKSNASQFKNEFVILNDPSKREEKKDGDWGYCLRGNDWDLLFKLQYVLWARNRFQTENWMNAFKMPSHFYKIFKIFVEFANSSFNGKSQT